MKKEEKKITKEQVKKALIATGGAVSLVGLGWFLGSGFSDHARPIKNGLCQGVYHPGTKSWHLFTYRNLKRADKGMPSKDNFTSNPEVLEYLIESASDALKQMKGE